MIGCIFLPPTYDAVMKKHLLIFALLLTSLPFPSVAAEIPRSILQAVVLVQCEDRQGSGTMIQATEKYILTNAHVTMNVETGQLAPSCLVGFVEDPVARPVYLYRASIVKSVFEQEGNLDFAILKITERVSVRALLEPFPALTTDEFSLKNDPVSIVGYPGGHGQLVISEGTIQDFERGFIQTDAQLSPGDSGGAAVNNEFHLIGIPTRIVNIISSDPRESRTTYELVDIRAVLNWLDTFGPNEHDKYFTHADRDRYHLTASFVTDASLGCVAYVRTVLDSTVFCLLPNKERFVFPNAKTFLSWQGDFRSVQLISLDEIAEYRIKRNVTYKPGSLIKSTTSPRVYVVVDDKGTLRWIPSEERANTLWGPAWAGLVKDVPDEFWINYRLGQPLE